jgi:hypothetical protein
MEMAIKMTTGEKMIWAAEFVKRADLQKCPSYILGGVLEERRKWEEKIAIGAAEWASTVVTLLRKIESDVEKEYGDCDNTYQFYKERILEKEYKFPFMPFIGMHLDCSPCTDKVFKVFYDLDFNKIDVWLEDLTLSCDSTDEDISDLIDPYLADGWAVSFPNINPPKPTKEE